MGITNNIYYNNLGDALIAWDLLASNLNDISRKKTQKPSEARNQYQIEQIDGKTIKYAIVQKKTWQGFRAESFGFLGQNKILTMSEIDQRIKSNHTKYDMFHLQAFHHLKSCLLNPKFDFTSSNSLSKKKEKEHVKIHSFGGYTERGWQLPAYELSTDKPQNDWNEVISLPPGFTIESVTKHIPQSELEMHSLASAISKIDLIPWHLSDGECSKRAELLIAFLKLMGIPEANIEKQYVIVPVEYRKSPYEDFMYHVAVVITAADGTKWIIDPLFSPNRALTLNEWMGFQTSRLDQVDIFTAKSDAPSLISGNKITTSSAFKELLPYIRLKLSIKAHGIRQEV